MQPHWLILGHQFQCIGYLLHQQQLCTLNFLLNTVREPPKPWEQSLLVDGVDLKGNNMRYAIVNSNGATEIREDSYPLQSTALELTDSQHEQLISGKYIFKDGQIIVNPNIFVKK